MKELLIFGNSQMADIVYTYFSTETNIKIGGFVVDGKFIIEDKFNGIPVIALEDIKKEFPPENCLISLVMGGKNVNRLREDKYNQIRSLGYSFKSFISSRATILPNSRIGDNCFILENNVIQHFTKIGSNSILWSGNHFGHHSTIGPNSYLASHVVISGRCKIGKNCYFGVNSSVKDGTKIGDYVVIGASANVMKNIEDEKVIMGLPGKTIPQKSSEVTLL